MRYRNISIANSNRFNFMGFRTFSLSIFLLLLISTPTLFFTHGINFGIDFVGGTIIEVVIPDEYDFLNVRTELLKNEKLGSITVQQLNSPQDVMISMKHNNDTQDATVPIIKQIIAENFGQDCIYKKTDYVGPQVSKELVIKGFIALVAALCGILIYLLIRFDWHFAIGGVLALLHDITASLLLFCVTNLEFSLTSVAALLTTVGYSINDSVVIFDRIREYISRYGGSMENFSIVNKSISSTLSRTLLTSITTLLATVPMMIVGAGEIQDFCIVIFLGILVGTYSSIFVATAFITKK